MPSLPTKNAAPECVLDAYRRYLPPSYRYSFELYIPNSFAVIMLGYLKFLALCCVYILLIFAVNFFFVYLQHDIADIREYRSKGFTFVHDLYWYILLSLFCFCFTFICYRKIPRTHIHVRMVSRCFSTNWKIALYFTSLCFSLTAFCIHYSLLVLEWNRHQISSNNSLDSVLTHWNIACNIFICDDWTLSRLAKFTIIPPFTLFINCFLLHYWLFGFHKDGYFDRHQKPAPNATKPAKAKPKQKFMKPSHSGWNVNPNKSMPVNSINASPELISPLATFDRYHESLSINSHSHRTHGNLPPPHYSLESAEEQPAPPDGVSINQLNLNKSGSLLADGAPKKPKSGISFNGSDLNVISLTAQSLSSRSSPLNSLLNPSFMGFRYPESKMLRWICVYCLAWMLVNIMFFALSNVQKQWYKRYFVQIFIGILCATMICKYILKRIARMIDASRGTSPATVDKVRRSKPVKITSQSSRDPLSNQFTEQLQSTQVLQLTYVSLELCTELYMDFIFFNAYRELMMYYIPNLEQFFKISVYFFAHEVWICSIRPSQIYYTISRRIQNMRCSQQLVTMLLCNRLRDGKHHNYDEERSQLSASDTGDTYRSVDPQTLKKRLLFFNWRDDSTLMQWQIRCSLDISSRILAGVISSVVIITEALFMGASHYELSRKSWVTGMLYIALSAGIQLAYFIIVYVWNFAVQNFPLLEPWWSLQKDNPYTWYFACVTLMAMAFWLPDL